MFLAGAARWCPVCIDAAYIVGLGLDLLDDRIRRSMLEVSAIHHTNIREVIQWMVEAAAKSLG